jgi:hypothetical protein
MDFGGLRERIARSPRLASTSQEDADAQEQRRCFLARSGLDERSQRGGGKSRFAERDEPRRELFAQRWILAEQQRTTTESCRHVELGAARRESARERHDGRALLLFVARRLFELGRERRELGSGPRATQNRLAELVAFER